MGKPVTLLEGLCGHALSLGAGSIEVEHKDGCEWVYARRGNTGISIAHYRTSGADAKELLGNLHAAARKPVLTVLLGRRSVLKVRVSESFSEEAFTVTIAAAPALDPGVPPAFTPKQGQYLAFIYHYSKIHRQAPAESDLQRYFRVSPPSIHEMIKTLERNGLIERVPGKARSIQVLVRPEHLPALE